MVSSQVIDLWNQFQELSTFRTDMVRLRPRDLIDYATLRRIRWWPWEVDALMAMDAMWVATTSKEMQQNRDRAAQSAEVRRSQKGAAF